MSPDPAKAAAYRAARASYDDVVISHGAFGHRAGHYDAILAAVDAVWDLAVEEGRRQSRVIDPEVAEVVADTIERWEKCRFEPHSYGPSPDGNPDCDVHQEVR